MLYSQTGENQRISGKFEVPIRHFPRIILENHGKRASPHVGPWHDSDTGTSHVAAKPEALLREPNFWCLRQSQLLIPRISPWTWIYSRCIYGSFFYCTVYRELVTVPSGRGTAVAQWLRCCATNREVAGSISDGVTVIFHWRNPSDRTMALGSTQPLTEMSTRIISWG